MGKIHIPNDLKSKLDKVLHKSTENTPLIAPSIPVINNIPELTLPKSTDESHKVIVQESEWYKFVFITSFIGGVGLVLGIKVGYIIFF